MSLSYHILYALYCGSNCILCNLHLGIMPLVQCDTGSYMKREERSIKLVYND